MSGVRREDETLPCFLNAHYCGLVSIFLMIDWTSEAASLHAREISWLLEPIPKVVESDESFVIMEWPALSQ